MNIVMISGIVTDIHFRGSSTGKLCADVDLDISDELHPSREPWHMHFTATGQMRSWREVKPGDYIEVRGKLMPNRGTSRDGSIAELCAFMPAAVKRRTEDE